MQAPTLALVLATAFACSQPPAAEDRGEGERGPAAPRDGATATGPVADGVLAEVAGASGTIRVEQRAGRRLLYIGDTLHASVAWAGGGPDPAAVDPLVSLLRAARPAARTALVIGLGSGDTAGDLARAGLEVTAVEIDPAVIEVATRWFGYQGKAVAADGRAFLDRNAGPWDLVVMDAFDGTRPPPGLVDAAGLALLRGRTAPAGATALRLYGEPGDAAVARIRAELRRGARGPLFEHLYGSGVGGEAQNLYLVAAGTPLNLVAVPGAAVWPVPDDLAALQAIAGGRAADPAGTPAPTRAVTLVGYVHRLAGGELALDLPHTEMGAVRYLLTGEAAGNLAASLPAGARFPTMGDIATDGDTSQTLRPLLGGGGAKRSDLRFSPLVAAVSGDARLLAVVHPDAASRVPAAARGAAATDERIPYGGALYELTVTTVHWTLDRAAWAAAAPELDRQAATAGTSAARGELAAAAAALQTWTDLLSRRLGARADLVPALRAARALADAMPKELARARATGTAFATGAACDRLHHAHATGAPPAVAAGLYRCAVDHYERTTRSDRGADGYDAAARLVYLLDPARAPDGKAEARRRALMKQFDIKQPLLFPPGSL